MLSFVFNRQNHSANLCYTSVNRYGRYVGVLPKINTRKDTTFNLKKQHLELSIREYLFVWIVFCTFGVRKVFF